MDQQHTNPPPAAITVLRDALDKATLVDDQPAYILGKLLDALKRGGWSIVRTAEHRNQVLTEAADHLDRIADQTEARVAEYYGPASGIGPGSADMVREAAKSVRELAARPATVQGA